MITQAVAVGSKALAAVLARRYFEQASAEAAGLDWVPQSKYSLPAPIVENAATCPVLVGTVQTISRH